MSDEPYSADNLAEFRGMVETGVNPQPDGSVIVLEPAYREWCRRWLVTLAERDAEIKEIDSLLGLANKGLVAWALLMGERDEECKRLRAALREAFESFGPILAAFRSEAATVTADQADRALSVLAALEAELAVKP